MQKFIYAGPSWAVTSYPDDEKIATNVAKEWNLQHIWVARCADNTLNQLATIEKLNTDLPVVFFYCEPIKNLEDITNLSFRDFVQSENWQEIWHQCNKYCLDAIDKIKNPVALIGAHSDIIQEDTSSFIIEDSWQKWIASQAGMKVEDGIIEVSQADGGNYNLSRCWGAEFIHRFLHENPSIKPHPSLLDAIWDIYFFWEELEKRNWFYQVHPNRIANIQFAHYTKDKIKDFLTTRSHYGTLS